MIFLVVDDNEISLSVEKIVLEDCGITVVTAGSGEKAVRLLGEHIYDVILMDIQMPGMDGYATAELIRRYDKKVPIVALSAYEIPADDEQFVRSGMVAAIQKPLKKEDVLDLIERFAYAQGHTPSSRMRGKNLCDFVSLRATMHSDDAVVHLLRQFLELHKSAGREVFRCIEEGDLYAARMIMHDILGQAENLCCRPLHDAALQLDIELKQNRWDSLQDFLQVWRTARREMQAYCGAREPKETETAAAVDLDKLKQELLSLCRSFDIQAAALFSRNEAAFQAHLLPEAFSALKTAITAYDFPYLIDNLEALYVSSSAG